MDPNALDTKHLAPLDLVSHEDKSNLEDLYSSLFAKTPYEVRLLRCTCCLLRLVVKPGESVPPSFAPHVVNRDNGRLPYSDMSVEQRCTARLRSWKQVARDAGTGTDDSTYGGAPNFEYEGSKLDMIEAQRLFSQKEDLGGIKMLMLIAEASDQVKDFLAQEWLTSKWSGDCDLNAWISRFVRNLPEWLAD
jgi:hypothetical protein